MEFCNWLPINAFICPEFDVEVLEDNGVTRTIRDRSGAIKKVSNERLSLPLTIESPVKDKKTWENIKPRLKIASGNRFPADWKNICEINQKSDMPSFIGGSPCGFYGALRELFGPEAVLYSFYDMPDVVNDMMDTLCEL
ncbi:MAG: hypothetical protein A2252_06835 [Elusimicrobia bacterium RIFOXYA2_FULL_39_19]|nr:MAG: hypothetical protein A2252_06835 [Elusimicrobia bacterium RIFOXYA2_FULL_39_19]